MRVRFLLLIVSLVLLLRAVATAQTPYLYKVQLIQAAPGKLLDLIDQYKASVPGYKAAGDEPPLWMRHSQGDHWDLLILIPMKSYPEYYSAERVAKRTQARPSPIELVRTIDSQERSIAWREDLFVYGPPIEELRAAFATASFFHVEMFHALAGKQRELFKERQMENAYEKALKRPENFIFSRVEGAAWDLFTIGAYRNLKHFAESADIPEAAQDAAAKASGFESANRIGPYLRTLISSHHDTLAVAIK
jgi:hypothetical protein